MDECGIGVQVNWSEIRWLIINEAQFDSQLNAYKWTINLGTLFWNKIECFSMENCQMIAI